MTRSMHFTLCLDISFRASPCVAVHNFSETIANAKENAFATNFTTMGLIELWASGNQTCFDMLPSETTANAREKRAQYPILFIKFGIVFILRAEKLAFYDMC